MFCFGFFLFFLFFLFYFQLAHLFVTCTPNSNGGFYCTCNAGYSGNGVTCTYSPDIVIRGTYTQVDNCYPFGGGGAGWQPRAAFVYRNIPAFNLRPGSRLFFDMGAVNEYQPCLNIYMNTGSATNTATRTLVVNQGTASSYGDTTPNNFDLMFTITGTYSFPGGALSISFDTPCGPFASDGSCDQVLVWSDQSDPSGFFDHREYAGTATSTSTVAVFKITQ